MKYKVLVVDDEPLNLRSTSMCLEDWGYDVDVADSGTKAFKKVEENTEGYAVILMDFRMPNMNGAQVAAKIQKINQEAIILMYSGDSSRVAALDSFRIGGAVDFIDKGSDTEVLREAVESACRKYEETTRLLRPHFPKTESGKLLASMGLVGDSTIMLKVASKILSYGSSEKPLMILGETGTGKESVARALHTGPSEKFFAVNCASFSQNNLFESELFGYEKGAFTGANQKRLGILELANGGTVFFDELHRMDLDSQGKLLRVLQEKKIRRVGGAAETAVDFRIITGTQPQITELVKEGKFLQDLYFRLKYLTLEVPPLRERPEDIGPLVSYFCEKFNEKNNAKKQFLMSTIRILEKYDWPGNVRELDGEIYQTLKDSVSNRIAPDQLNSQLFKDLPAKKSSNFEELKRRQEWETRHYLLSVLKTSKSVAQAAERMGLSSSTLKSMLAKFRIKSKPMELDPLKS